MFRRRTASIAILLGTAGLLAACGSVMQSSAQAPMTLRATLSSAQEVPPNPSAGTGSATMTFNQASKQLTWNITYGGLTGPATMAHFHGPAAPGANAGVALPIGAAGMASPAAGSATLNDAQVADLLAGRWYINIHTAAHPGGEIRGQVMR